MGCATSSTPGNAAACTSVQCCRECGQAGAAAAGATGCSMESSSKTMHAASAPVLHSSSVQGISTACIRKLQKHAAAVAAATPWPPSACCPAGCGFRRPSLGGAVAANVSCKHSNGCKETTGKALADPIFPCKGVQDVVNGACFRQPSLSGRCAAVNVPVVASMQALLLEQ